MAYKEDLDIGKITLIGLVSVLLLVAIVLFLQVLYYGFKQDQLASPRYTQVPAEMAKYVADQQGRLASYEVVDRERSVVTMPIERAMQLVVADLAADPQAHVTGVPDPEDAVEPPQQSAGEEETTENSDPGKSDTEKKKQPEAGSAEQPEPESVEETAPATPPGDDDPAETAGEDSEVRAEESSDAES